MQGATHKTVEQEDDDCSGNIRFTGNVSSCKATCQQVRCLYSGFGLCQKWRIADTRRSKKYNTDLSGLSDLIAFIKLSAVNVVKLFHNFKTSTVLFVCVKNNADFHHYLFYIFTFQHFHLKNRHVPDFRDAHTCMPIPLAPNPIRVQSCICCLF